MNWEKYLNKHFSNKDMQMANNYMIKRLSIIIIREMKIKAAVKSHFTATRMAAIEGCPGCGPARVGQSSIGGNEECNSLGKAFGSALQC